MFDFAPAPEPAPSFVQGSLWCGGEAVVPAGFGGLEHIDLGRGAWLDWRPDWLPGSDTWFATMRDRLPWISASRPMYERIVEVPRLICSYGEDDRANDGSGLLDELAALRSLFEQHYGRRFGRVGANWYRHGGDSVAFHPDRVPFPGDSIVAIVAVGERRPFLLRELGDPFDRADPATSAGRVHSATRKFEFGRGDLLVMGGTTQAFWQHAVPKVARSTTRISLMFRSLDASASSPR